MTASRLHARELADVIARLLEEETPAVVDALAVEEGPLFAPGLRVELGRAAVRGHGRGAGRRPAGRVVNLLRRSRTFTVFVNRRSGMAHRRRDCETLVNVPDGALRRQLVENGYPRFRYCSRCSG